MSRLELVYRVEVVDCLYVPASRDSIIPYASEARIIRCGDHEIIVPYVPGPYVAKTLGISGKGIIVTGLHVPCDIVESILSAKGFVELGDFFEYRYLRTVERMLGVSVSCPLVLVKHGVVLEGRIVFEDPCDKIESIRLAYNALSEGIRIGGLQEAGCGYLRVKEVTLAAGGRAVRLEEVDRLCVQR